MDNIDEILTRGLSSPDVDGPKRAADELERLGEDPVQVLSAFAADRSRSAQLRQRAAETLCEIDIEAGRALLERLLASSDSAKSTEIVRGMRRALALKSAGDPKNSSWRFQALVSILMARLGLRSAPAQSDPIGSGPSDGKAGRLDEAQGLRAAVRKLHGILAPRLSRMPIHLDGPGPRFQGKNRPFSDRSGTIADLCDWLIGHRDGERPVEELVPNRVERDHFDRTCMTLVIDSRFKPGYYAPGTEFHTYTHHKLWIMRVAEDVYKWSVEIYDLDIKN